MAGSATQTSNFVRALFINVRSATVSIEIHYFCNNYYGLVGIPVPPELSRPVHLNSYLAKRMPLTVIQLAKIFSHHFHVIAYICYIVILLLPSYGSMAPNHKDGSVGQKRLVKAQKQY